MHMQATIWCEDMFPLVTPHRCRYGLWSEDIPCHDLQVLDRCDGSQELFSRSIFRMVGIFTCLPIVHATSRQG